MSAYVYQQIFSLLEAESALNTRSHKNELGLDHNETRSWHGWHRHVSLVMLAFAMMAAIRRQANNNTPPPKTNRWTTTPKASRLHHH